jgi:hypothetical protein
MRELPGSPASNDLRAQSKSATDFYSPLEAAHIRVGPDRRAVDGKRRSHRGLIVASPTAPRGGEGNNDRGVRHRSYGRSPAEVSAHAPSYVARTQRASFRFTTRDRPISTSAPIQKPAANNSMFSASWGRESLLGSRKP